MWDSVGEFTSDAYDGAGEVASGFEPRVGPVARASEGSAAWLRRTDKANCIEVTVLGAAVAVRDAKHPTGGALIVSPRAWAAFTTALRDGNLG